jgi:copper chaperone CopZ
MKLAIEGMHCDACVRRVRKAIEKVEGTRIQSVQVGSAVVDAVPGKEDAVLQAVRDAGYPAQAA